MVFANLIEDYGNGTAVIAKLVANKLAGLNVARLILCLDLTSCEECPVYNMVVASKRICHNESTLLPQKSPDVSKRPKEHHLAGI